MITKQQKAFLDLIAWSEGTSTSKWTKNNGYDIIVDGINSPHVFTDYSTHPGITVHVKDSLYSTAAGRYQTLKRFALTYIRNMQLPDFGPDSQDKIALQQIRECRAIDLIENGNIQSAISACNRIWASLPGAKYGQPTHDMAECLDKFQEFGGTVTE